MIHAYTATTGSLETHWCGTTEELFTGPGLTTTANLDISLGPELLGILPLSWLTTPRTLQLKLAD